MAKSITLKRNNENQTQRITKVSHSPRMIIYLIIKRIFDILVGIIGTAVVIPLTIVIWILRKIYKEDDGPLFYEQLRIGKDGKRFRLYKFRSMCMNADEKLQSYLDENPEAKKEYKKYKKLKNDPRITKTGQFLRATSLDEFPQFFNVLIGNMSFVGPRPYLPREKEEMTHYEEIVKCKPGVTGWWQVNGRSNTDFETRNEQDKEYEEKRSIIFDIKIMFMTVAQTIKRKGAF